MSFRQLAVTSTLMETALLAFVLSVLGPGPDARPVAEAIVNAVEADADNAPLTGSHAEDAAFLAVYVRHESGASVLPRPQSWDSKAGVSCGAFQMPCAIVRRTTLETQASTIIRWGREGGLPGLFGYGRAAKRIAGQRCDEARDALAAALRF